MWEKKSKEKGSGFWKEWKELKHWTRKKNRRINKSMTQKHWLEPAIEQQ